MRQLKKYCVETFVLINMTSNGLSTGYSHQKMAATKAIQMPHYEIDLYSTLH